MIVEQIWTANAWRNFNYLVACAETGEALAIDPLDHRKCLARALKRGWTIRQVLNTHEHGDHTGGNAAMVEATGAQVLAHANAAARIPEMTRGLKAGDVIAVGRTAELECLDTPGHTMAHICLLARGDQPALFSRRHALQRRRRQLPQRRPSAASSTGPSSVSSHGWRTRPGSTRATTTSRATSSSRSTGSRRTRARRSSARRRTDMDPADPIVTTLGLEKEINVFFRLQSAEVIRQLRAKLPDLPASPTPEDVFLALRELRNKW